MDSKLKTIHAGIDNVSPAVGGLIRRLYLRKPFNSVKSHISGKQNIIRYGNSILSSVLFDIKGDMNHIEVKNGCLLNGVTFFIRGDGHSIQIGKGCSFNRGGSLWFEDHGCSLLIGDGTTFEDIHIAVTEPGSKVEIGEDCLFAYDTDIRTGDSHSIIDAISNERLNYGKDVAIGKHVWVAAHCILLKGSSVLEDSVVATGSVVTKRFEEKGVVIAGNPAKIVKRHISWSRKRIQ